MVIRTAVATLEALVSYEVLRRLTVSDTFLARATGIWCESLRLTARKCGQRGAKCLILLIVA